MASEQVSLVIETEKIAAQIELDARRQAEDIISSAEASALAHREAVYAATNDEISGILASAHAQADYLLSKEESSAAKEVLVLHTLAGQHKEKAVQSAVNMLIGKAKS